MSFFCFWREENTPELGQQKEICEGMTETIRLRVRRTKDNRSLTSERSTMVSRISQVKTTEHGASKTIAK